MNRIEILNAAIDSPPEVAAHKCESGARALLLGLQQDAVAKLKQLPTERHSVVVHIIWTSHESLNYY